MKAVERNYMKKAIERVSITIAARASNVKMGAFCFGALIPPLNQVVFGRTFPAPLFLAAALVTGAVSSTCLRILRGKSILSTKDDGNHLKTKSGRPASHAALICFEALDQFTFGLTLAALLTYLFNYVRDNR